MLKKFTKNQTSDLTLAQVQDNLVNCLNPLFNNPLLDGVLVKNIALVTGSNIINNPIQRAIQGVIFVNKNAFSDFNLSAQATNPTPINTIIINLSASVTCDLWIF